jgi:phosphatidylinositol alpha 1,6-mannosyltransferase
VTAVPRVAFLTDSFTEVNGVARTSRALVGFAAGRGLPMLYVHGGATTHATTSGSVTSLSLARSAAGFGLDQDLRFDLFLWRHRSVVMQALRAFQPDIIHITGPSDVGQLGAYLSHVLRIPLVGSWHTNVHDFAATRLDRSARLLPAPVRRPLVEAVRDHTLRLVLDFYRIPRRLLAPNPDLVQLLAQGTGRPVDLMPRGVDVEQFSPCRAERRPASSFRIGYVGRLSPEKNVRVLADLERGLLSLGHTDFQLVIIGDGSERSWLEGHLAHAEFLGVLHGEALARAYANLDVFVFPSETDTFGNVVLEACASGVPVVAASKGGPRFIVEPGVSGYLAESPRDFIGAVDAVMGQSPAGRTAMRTAARERALRATWPAVFEGVYESYAKCLQDTPAAAPNPAVRPGWIGRSVLAGVRLLTDRRANPAVSTR